MLARHLSMLKERTNSSELLLESLEKEVRGYKKSSEERIKDKKVMIRFNVVE
jgi:hypothetical protein